MLIIATLGAVGFAAQLVNTGLGMGYGISSTTVLLALGTGPAAAAATVNVSQVGSQLVSGLAHWRLGNVDWAVVWRIALPGAAGAFTGATMLSWLSTEAAGPVVSGVLLGLGLYLLVRFQRRGPAVRPGARPLRSRFLAPLGLVGGFLNSTGGGGWGPVGTSALLATGRLAARTVIGSISAAEAAVVLAGSAGFAAGLGLAGIHLHWAAAMLAGGLVAAPVAARLATRVPTHLLGVLVGGLIVVINLRAVLSGNWLHLPDPARATVLAAGVLLWAAVVVRTARRHRTAPAARPPRAGVPEPPSP